MKKPLLFAFFLAISIIAFSSNSEIISAITLKTKLQEAPDSLSKLNALTQLVDFYIKDDNEENSYFYLNRSLNLIKKIEEPFAGIETYRLAVTFHANKKDYGTAIDYNKKLISLLKAAHLYKELAESYSKMSTIQVKGVAYDIARQYLDSAISLASIFDTREEYIRYLRQQGFLYSSYIFDYKQAMVMYQKALSEAIQSNNKAEQSFLFRQIAYVLGTQKEDEKAIEFYLKAITVATELKDIKLIEECNSSIGNIYEQKNDSTKAIEYYQAIYDIEKANDFKNTTAPMYAIIGKYFLLSNDIKTGIDYLKKSKSAFVKAQDYRWSCFLMAEISTVYLSKRDYTKAINYALQGIDMAKENKIHTYLVELYKHLAKIYKEIHETEKAKQYQNLADKLEKEIANGSDVEEIIAMQQKMEEEMKLQQIEKKQSNTTMYGILALIVVLGIIVVVIIKKKK